MTKYIIEGGHPLRGEINISGAKNAAVAIIPAAILVDGVCRIENIPKISDVTLMLDILRELGAKSDDLAFEDTAVAAYNARLAEFRDEKINYVF